MSSSDDPEDPRLKARPFSANVTDWFQGSGLEPTAMQALPAESLSIRGSIALRSEAEPLEQRVPRQSPETSNIGGVLQLLAIGLCLETLLGVSDGVGLMLRLFLVAVIMSCVVLRLGWLTLVALQISLLIQEPSRQHFDQAPLGFCYVLVAMLTVVAAMKLPHTHRYNTDTILRLFNIAMSRERSKSATQALALLAVHMTAVAILTLFLLMNLPIRGRSESWLKWSLQNGQAVWPGALLLSAMIALLVVVREIAWRQLDRSQASLYLRSIQMIANYRDILRFERHRRMQLRKVLARAQQSSRVTAKPMRTRMREVTMKTDSKGLK